MSEGLLLAGRYRLVHQLGAGGMGTVWLAQDLNLGTEIAIKLIDPTIAESVEAVGRFRHEAQAAAMIRSTHVVSILDYGVDQGRPYIAMELLKGESLGERLERLGQLSPAQTAKVLGHVGRALAIAHAWGITHRDLKPDNVFLVYEGDDEIAKLLDFGVARRSDVLSLPSQSKTRSGALLGTPYYMSPEQATGQMVDHLTDVWSFGVMACECLTGRRGFEGDSVGELFHSICMRPLPIPSTLAEVPAGFDEWFNRAVARDKTRRFQTIKEAAETLRLVCGWPSRLSQSAELSSGQRTLVSSDREVPTLAGKAVSAVVHKCESLETTRVGRVRMRRRVFVVAAVSVLALAGLALKYFGSGDGRSTVTVQRMAVYSALPKASDGTLACAVPSVVTPAKTTVKEATPATLPRASPEKPKAIGKSGFRPLGGTTKMKPIEHTQPSKALSSIRDDNAAGI